jgi:hypothetical protein
VHAWDAAIEKFKESYRIRASDKALYNIAQASRLGGHCVEAIEYYKDYKREYPAAQELPLIEKFLVELQPCADAQAKSTPAEPVPPRPMLPASTPPPRPPSSSPPPVPRMPPPPPPAPPDHSLLPTALLVGGGASVAAGGVFALLARAKANDASSGSGQWQPDLQDAGNRDALLGKIFLSVGAAAIAGGIVLRVTGHRADAVEHVSLVPRAGGAAVGWSCAF